MSPRGIVHRLWQCFDHFVLSKDKRILYTRKGDILVTLLPNDQMACLFPQLYVVFPTLARSLPFRWSGLFWINPRVILWVYSSFSSTPDHLLLDNAPNFGPLISRWEINKFENCWYKSVKILEVPKLFFSNFWICQVPNEIWVVQY